MSLYKLNMFKYFDYYLSKNINMNTFYTDKCNFQCAPNTKSMQNHVKIVRHDVFGHEMPYYLLLFKV